jgi:hypothetical protein
MEIDLNLWHQLIHLELLLVYVTGSELSSFKKFPRFKNLTNLNEKVSV